MLECPGFAQEHWQHQNPNCPPNVIECIQCSGFCLGIMAGLWVTQHEEAGSTASQQDSLWTFWFISLFWSALHFFCNPYARILGVLVLQGSEKKTKPLPLFLSLGHLLGLFLLSSHYMSTSLHLLSILHKSDYSFDKPMTSTSFFSLLCFKTFRTFHWHFNRVLGDRKRYILPELFLFNEEWY